jgi:tetratricopeptide (TPR) repeat protein
MRLFFPLLLFLVSTSMLYSQAAYLIEVAGQLSRQGKYTASNDSLSVLIDRYGKRLYDVGEAYYLRSYNHLQLGKLDDAKSDNEASTKIHQRLNPEELGKNAKRAGEIALAEEKYDEAIAALKEAAAYPYFDEPEIPVYIEMLMGDAYAQQSAWKEAGIHYEAALNNLAMVIDSTNNMQSDLILRYTKTQIAQKNWGAIYRFFFEYWLKVNI